MTSSAHDTMISQDTAHSSRWAPTVTSTSMQQNGGKGRKGQGTNTRSLLSKVTWKLPQSTSAYSPLTKLSHLTTHNYKGSWGKRSLFWMTTCAMITLGTGLVVDI